LRMWEPMVAALAGSGRRCVAPDLYGLGDSGADAPTTFEGVLEAFTTFMDELDLGPVAIVVHDWGGFVGLAWACDHPDRVSALVISDTGFFSDGKWHGPAEAVRGPDGEAFIEAINREGFAALLASFGDAFDDEDVTAYWAPFEDDGRGQRATLGFYRSMDFEKLEPWQGKLAEIGAPALLLWGSDDLFAPLAGAKRLQGEIPGSKLVALEGVGHFVFDEAVERSVEEVRAFLAECG
jgi:haloalkane dehalogenase